MHEHSDVRVWDCPLDHLREESEKVIVHPDYC